MTLNEITKMAMDLAVAGHINGERFTESRLQNTLKAMLRKDGDKYIFEISMPDGRWYCKATRDWYGYDLDVPDDREHEAHIKAELFGA